MSEAACTAESKDSDSVVGKTLGAAGRIDSAAVAGCTGQAVAAQAERRTLAAAAASEGTAKHRTAAVAARRRLGLAVQHH